MLDGRLCHEYRQLATLSKVLGGKNVELHEYNPYAEPTLAPPSDPFAKMMKITGHVDWSRN